MRQDRLLEGHSAIVTGAARGIGWAISQRLAESGASVLLADIDSDVIKLAQSLEKEYHIQSEDYVGDLSQEENCQEMVNKAIRKWGKVDILVNNAGGGVILPFLQHTAETLRTTINRNLWTTLWACRAVLPHMVSRRYGRIINVGADSVRTGLFDHAAYNAAKGGVHGLTTGLAREFAPYDITVNTVAPCAVDTPQLKEAAAENPHLVEKFISVIPKGRPAKMREVADVVAFLALPQTAFITGQVISVNGGSAML